MRAKAAGIRLAPVALLALHEARRGWQARMAELLLGGPRTGRDHTVTNPDPGKALPGGEMWGNHGRGALAGALLGSVAPRCAPHASGPVLLVPDPPEH